MTMDSILGLLRQRPFEAFRIITSSGESYRVRHPEMALPIRNGLYLGLGAKNGVADRAAFVSLNRISTIEKNVKPGTR